MKFVADRDVALQIAMGLAHEKNTFTLGESAMLLDLAGSQRCYRWMASVLRRKFGRRVVESIDRLVAMPEVMPSPVWADTFEVEDVSDGPRQTVTASAWHVLDVPAELARDLASLGRRAQYGGRFVIMDGELWLVWGGDRGGDSFKFGCFCANVNEPQNPLNIVLLLWLRGVKDDRATLLRTALRHEFTEQVDALATKDVLHIVTASRDTQPGEALAYTDSHAVLFAPKSLEVVESFVNVSDTELGLRLAPRLEADGFPGCYGALAAHRGVVVGVAVIGFAGRVDERLEDLGAGRFDGALRARISSYVLAEGAQGPLDRVVLGVLPLAAPVPLGQCN